MARDTLNSSSAGFIEMHRSKMLETVVPSGNSIVVVAHSTTSLSAPKNRTVTLMLIRQGLPSSLQQKEKCQFPFENWHHLADHLTCAVAAAARNAPAQVEAQTSGAVAARY